MPHLVEITCPTCRRRFGVSNRGALAAKAIDLEISRTGVVSLVCPSCGTVRPWAPAEPRRAIIHTK